ncbi:MAG: ferrous iron transport protein B [Muribaculaceae bacterium]|nr:ferrous iron transport protein B [Muribaculaceae bacterium]
MKLTDLTTGQTGIVVKIHGHGAFRKRVMEMGFVRGHAVRVVLAAPLKDPINYSILGSEVSLRAAEADMIDVVPVDAADAAVLGQSIMSMPPERSLPKLRDNYHKESRAINVVLIGNPNCGKTTLFNAVSGAHEHTGNYSGVTVDAKGRTFVHGDYRFNIVDLPGTYSLSCYSPEELYVREYLKTNTPDVIINVVDASNLERNLYLTTELIDMDYPMVIALNMYDELLRQGAKLDYEALGAMIGVPMVPVTSKTGEGVGELFDTVLAVYEGRNDTVRHVHVNLGNDIESAIRPLVDAIKASPWLSKHFSPRYLAIKLLEGDHVIEDEIPADTAEHHIKSGHESCPWWRRLWRRKHPRREQWHEHLPSGVNDPIIMLRDKLRARIESINDEDVASIVATEKYGFVAGALAETFQPGHETKGKTSRVLDSLATNRLLGFPIFFAIMIFIFWATFAVGQYPMEWIESLVGFLGTAVDKLMPAGPLKDMIADGIIGGVGGVIVFLPNILILFFCISFMEDSGYMARAAFIMDKVMHRIGLHGKSFIPLVMGFGCNVPAIIASRSIESRSSRIITVLINPFMSCSARLPIYVLLIGAFFPAHAGLVMAGLYFGGVLVAVVTARLLRKYLFKKDETPFVMELPPYRLPNMRTSLIHTWEKGKQYLKKMGGIILFASIIVWALNYFPLHNETIVEEQHPVLIVHDDSSINPATDSYLEMAGKAINPLMRPLGFHWRATVAAMAGVPAKEIVVSTLGVLYTGDEETSDSRLGERLKQSSPVTGHPDFDPAAALAFMVFILLYCPCIATITAIGRETGAWRYAAFSIIYNTLVAWLAAFAVYRVSLLIGV